jgi:hypothetical protein
MACARSPVPKRAQARRIGWHGAGEPAAADGLETPGGAAIVPAAGIVERQEQRRVLRVAGGLGQLPADDDRAVELAARDVQREHLPTQLEIVGVGQKRALEALRRLAQITAVQREAAHEIAARRRLVARALALRCCGRGRGEAQAPPAALVGAAGGQEQHRCRRQQDGSRQRAGTPQPARAESEALGGFQAKLHPVAYRREA